MIPQLIQLGLMAGAPALKALGPKPPTPEEMMRRLFQAMDQQMAPAKHGLFAAEAGAAAGMRQNLAAMMGRSGAGGSGMGMVSGGLADAQFGASAGRSEMQYRQMLQAAVTGMMGNQGDANSWMRPGAGHKVIGGYGQLLSSPDFAGAIQSLLKSINSKPANKGNMVI